MTFIGFGSPFHPRLTGATQNGQRNVIHTEALVHSRGTPRLEIYNFYNRMQIDLPNLCSRGVCWNTPPWNYIGQ